jgi:multiple sugar transport system substrate-binding protein
MRRVLALAALACGCGDAGTTTLRLWAMGSEGELVISLVAAFERTHPGIRVDVQQLPWTSAHEKLLTAFVGDATPDVAQLGNTWLPELAALGALAPLDDQVAASSVVSREDYYDGVWKTNLIDGALYGVPWYVDTRLVFYRRDVEAAGLPPERWTSWPTWLDAMRTIKERVGAGRYAILLPLDEPEQLVAFALQGGEPLVRDGQWGNFRNAGFRRALTFYLEIFAERLAPIATGTQVSNPWDELARGYFSFFIHGPFSIGEFTRRLPAAQQGIWATAALPGPTGPGVSIAGGSSLVVFRRSTHKREAWQLIEYLSQPDVQSKFHELSGNLPPRRTTWDDPRFAGDEHLRAFRDQLERLEPTPPVPEWERIATEMRVVSERVARQVAGTTAAQRAAIVDAAAAELDARTDQILEKRRWILARGAR